MRSRYYSIAVTTLLLACDDRVEKSTAPEPPRGIEFAESARAVEKYLSAGLSEEACQIASRLAELNPRDAQAQELSGRAWALAAAQAKSADERKVALEKALVAYEAACEATPEWAGVHHAAGMVASQSGRSEDAIRHFAAAGKAEPENAQYPLFEGLALLAVNRLDEAHPRLELARALAPDSPWPFAALSDEALARADCETALSMARQARSLDRSEVGLRVSEAKALRCLGRHQEILDLLNSVSPDARATEAIAWELSHANSALGRLGDAAEAWDAVASRGSISAALEAARAWIAAEDLERARNWLEAATAAGADQAVVQELRLAITAANARRQGTTPAP